MVPEAVGSNVISQTRCAYGSLATRGKLILKPRDSRQLIPTRYPTVTLGPEARRVHDHSRIDAEGPVSISPAFTSQGVLFSDLRFDAHVGVLHNMFTPVAYQRLYIHSYRRSKRRQRHLVR
jgi:hypothetical protein